MKICKRNIFNEKMMKVIDELMIDKIMRVLNSRVRDTDKLIEELKELCNEEIL